jgi:CMP-N-acetylneuraminic acid synthetase
MYRVESQSLKPYINQQNLDNKPRQLLEELFIKDGAYYLLKRSILRQRTLLGELMLPLFRSGLCTINIDTLVDFQMAELVVDPYSA